MILHVAIILSLFAAFVDAVAFKVGAWGQLSRRSVWIAKMVDCELCRSWWVCVMYAPLVWLFWPHDLTAGAFLLAVPAATVLKLINSRLAV